MSKEDLRKELIELLRKEGLLKNNTFQQQADAILRLFTAQLLKAREEHPLDRSDEAQDKLYELGLELVESEMKVKTLKQELERVKGEKEELKSKYLMDTADLLPLRNQIRVQKQELERVKEAIKEKVQYVNNPLSWSHKDRVFMEGKRAGLNEALRMFRRHKTTNREMSRKKKFGYELDFISLIKRDGGGTIPVGTPWWPELSTPKTDDVKHLNHERFEIKALSMSEKTYIASCVNSWVVRLKNQ